MGPLVGLVVGLVLLAGCGSAPAAAPLDLTDRAWVLQAATVDGAAVGPDVATLVVHEDRVHGSAGCNVWSGRAVVAGDRVDLGPMRLSRQDCDADQEQAEVAYVTALDRVSTGYDDDGVLVLSGPGVELRFGGGQPEATPTWAGTTWRLAELSRDGVVVPAGQAPATLLLAEDGSLSGSTGCRDLTGTWVPDGTSVVLTQLEATGTCPALLLDQDGLVVRVLGDRAEVTTQDGRLTLRGSQGGSLTFAADG